MEEENRNYFAIIPANIRYDNTLTANAKLLYGEITALCNDKGYCWATNGYFAKLYNVSERSITNWIYDLHSKGYIKCSKPYDGDKNSKYYGYRKIFLGGIENIFYPTVEKNFYHNNTYINNTSNNKKEDNNKLLSKKENFKKPSLEEVQEYCKERKNNVDAQTFIDFYESKDWMIGKNKMKDWKASIRTWERNRKRENIKEEKIPEWFNKDFNEEKEVDKGYEDFLRAIHRDS